MGTGLSAARAGASDQTDSGRGTTLALAEPKFDWTLREKSLGPLPLVLCILASFWPTAERFPSQVAGLSPI